MHIPNKNEFKPSTQALRLWLGTRKMPHYVGGVSMPAFFSDDGNAEDTTWMYYVVAGELAGLIATIYGGLREGGLFLLLAIMGIVVCILFDFVFARILHEKKIIQCEIETLQLLVDGTIDTIPGTKLTPAAQLQLLEQRKSKGVFKNIFCIAGIIVIACLKLVAILLLGVFNNIILYFLFFAIFALVAYIHIMHTGYYQAYLRTQSAINKDYKSFPQGLYPAGKPKQPVETSIPLSEVPIKYNPHSIVKNPNPDLVGNHYFIETVGILTDDEIINLISGQVNANKIVLFKACRKLQLENI